MRRSCADDHCRVAAARRGQRTAKGCGSAVVMRSLCWADRHIWHVCMYENDYANQRTPLRSGFRAAAAEDYRNGRTKPIKRDDDEAQLEYLARVPCLPRAERLGA